MRRGTNGSRRSPTPATESSPTKTRRTRNPAAPTPARAARHATTPVGPALSSADPPGAAEELGDQRLGPYELRYDVRRGYGIERTVVRP